MGGVHGDRWSMLRAEHMGAEPLYVPASPHIMWCRLISLQLEQDFQTFPVGAKEGTVEEEEDTVNVSEDCSCWSFSVFLHFLPSPPVTLSLSSSHSPLQLLQLESSTFFLSPSSPHLPSPSLHFTKPSASCRTNIC